MRFSRPLARAILAAAGLSLSSILVVSGVLVFDRHRPASVDVGEGTGQTSVRAQAVSSQQTVVISIDLLQTLLAEDLRSNRQYVDRVRARRGDAAAIAAEANIRGPYQQRIDQIRASGADYVIQQIPMVTVWGALSFSAVSYDGSIGPKDPVSVLFDGDTSITNVYERMLRASPADGAFQDEDGAMDSASMRECRSQSQWVLMGNSGGPLDWRKNQGGMMRARDKCTVGSRDHIRFYGDVLNPVYGHWFVATPHRETWIAGYGHRVDSWTSAQQAFSTYWLNRSFAEGTSTQDAEVVRSTSFDWGNNGWYQGVPHSGIGVCIGLWHQAPDSWSQGSDGAGLQMP